jgi:Prokaryotic cytochrome b561
MAVPYQPSLLRLLHGLSALVAGLCWFTGLAIYSQFDGRWGRLPLRLPEAIDLHGSLGVLLIVISALFVPYALTLGQARLRRPANAVALMALLLCLGSGLLMNEDWLPSQELDHWLYHLHLIAWVLLSAAVLWHLIALFRRGGPGLALSMLQWRIRPGDGPGDWPEQLRRFFGFPPSPPPAGPPD